ncbi:hypothetical protein [Noviherbaspirillum sedimenti]|nr:hypothetical protein [Noviherbaspirillum sedimenti]
MALGYVIFIDGELWDSAGSFESYDEAFDYMIENGDNTDGSNYEVCEFE